MSQNASPHSRPPSSASSASSSSATNLPRVHATSHGHDHTRPLPPPRLSETGAVVTISSSSLTSLIQAPLTVPLAPLSSSASFRSNNSRTPIIGSVAGANAIASSNNNGAASLDNSASSVNATSAATRVAPSEGARNPLGEVTLTVPRPDVERAVNEYVETPFRQANPTTTSSATSTSQKCLKNERRHHHRHSPNHHRAPQSRNNRDASSQPANQRLASQSKSPIASARVSAHARNNNDNNGARLHQSLLQSSLAASTATVTKQPVSFTKEPSNPLGAIGTAAGRLNDPSVSIMCDFCGRCRCESCREPPPLPSRWLCDNACFCSAETALDYASCLCCVKGLFYHCADSGSGTDSEAGGNCADEPCSCTGPRRTARWACLGALTLVLPCLMCYWPLKGCVAMCEACYARHASQGCRCDPNAHARHHHASVTGGAASVVSRDSRDPEKRLLDPVTPEL